MRRRFATGGLAMAVGGGAEDEDDAPLTGALIPTPGKAPAMPVGQATDILSSARDRLLAQRQPDKSGQWLAMAQGMLAPTKTGGFGESLGRTAGLVAEARTAERERLTDIDKSLIQTELSLQKIQAQGVINMRARLGSERLVYHPDDEDLPIADRRVVSAQTVIKPDGTQEVIFKSAEDGSILEVAATVNPETVRAVTEAKEEAKNLSDLIQQDVSAGISAMTALPKLQGARAILDQVETSGLKATAARLGTYLGIDIADTASLQVMQSQLGQTILSELQKLSGPKSDFEFTKIEEMNARITGNTEANKEILDQMITSYMSVIEEGAIAANELNSTYAKRKYKRWVDRQSGGPGAPSLTPAGAGAPFEELSDEDLAAAIKEAGG